MNELKLSEDQKFLARLLTKQFIKNRDFLIKRFGLDYKTLTLQIDYWVSANTSETEVYNRFHLYQFTRFLEQGFVGYMENKINQEILETSMKKEDGSPAVNALSFVLEEEGRGEERLDFVTILSRLSKKDLESIPGPRFFRRLRLNWKTFFQAFKDCSFSYENIKEKFDLQEWERKSVSKSMNEDLAPALRRFFPEYIEGEAKKISFKSGERKNNGSEEKYLKMIVHQLSKPGQSVLSKKTAIGYALGASEAKKASKERLEVIDRAFDLGLNTGVLKRVTTKTGLEGFSLND